MSQHSVCCKLASESAESEDDLYLAARGIRPVVGSPEDRVGARLRRPPDSEERARRDRAELEVQARVRRQQADRVRRQLQLQVVQGVFALEDESDMASYRGVKFSRGVGFPDSHGNKVDTEVFGAAYKSLSDQVVNPAGAGQPPVYQLNQQRAKQFFLSTLAEGASTTLMHAVTLEVQPMGQAQNMVAPGACTYEELRRGFERLFASQNPGVQALQAESKVKHRPWLGEDVRAYADSLQNVWVRQPGAFSDIGKLRQFKKGLCDSLHPKLKERQKRSPRERVTEQAIGINDINDLVEFVAAVEEVVQQDANDWVENNSTSDRYNKGIVAQWARDGR